MSGVTGKRSSLTDNEFDLLIIGGGVTGAWLSLHASRSGYRTALIEQQDFASQTSSSSSKLLHGGIRYLQQLQFGKVRESALERAHYIYAAPHLSHAVPFLIPTYRDFARSKFFLRCGMLAYRMLTIGEDRIIDDPIESVPGDSSLSRSELNGVLDLGDEPHTGAVQFYERHMLNSERMVLSILRTAEQHGATLANYCEARKLLVSANRVVGVLANDRCTDQQFEVTAKLVINAAGPWIDELNTQAVEKPPRINGFAIGSHLITRKISEHAIALATGHQSDAKLDRGGRHVFVIPWNGHSLIGTSYDEIEKPGRDLLPTPSDISQLLDAVNTALPTAKLSTKDVVSGYSGLYPLRTDTIKSSVYQGSGEYVIIDHADEDQTDGLVTALGAKFTTGRKLSALTMRLVKAKLGGRLDLSKVRLQDSQYESYSQFARERQAHYKSQLPATLIDHLLRLYGSNIDAVVELAEQSESMRKPIVAGQPDIMAQAVYAAANEHATNLEDILFRRTSSGFLGLTVVEAEQVATQVASIMGWSEEDISVQVSRIEKRLDKLESIMAAAAS